MIEEVNIKNLLGEIIYHTKANGDKISFQLKKAGIYFVQVITDRQNSIKKIVVE